MDRGALTSMFSRPALAIDLGRRRLRALQGVLEGGAIRIRQALVAATPADLNLDDAAAVGRWIGQTLRSAGFESAPATIALPREDVVLKRLTLPTVERDELPEMVRFAMLRELPFGADGAVIDFVSLQRDPASTTVMAVAVSSRKLAFIREATTAAGFAAQRVSLRCAGVAALAGESGHGADDAGCLVIDLTGEGVEFSVSRSGALRFSRAAEIADSDDPSALAEAVATETRRTWMSYRMADDAEPVRRAVLLGEGELRERLAASLREILGVPVETWGEQARVRSEHTEWSAAWPLAGLLLEPVLGRELINLLQPRKAPDHAARRRQRALAAAGIGLIAVLASWTIGRQNYSRLERRAQELKSEANAAGPGAWRSFRDEDRLAHVQQWIGLETDWLEQAERLHRLLPHPTDVVLDSWSANVVSSTVAWDKVSRTWSAEKELRIVLEGEARTRATADAFRERLVNDETYLTTSTGSESAGGRRLSDPFSFELRASYAMGADGAAAPQPSGGAGP